jgi:cytochrome d ubiquinol oxidase subunit I
MTYWTFRAMVGAGVLMILLALVALYLAFTVRLERQRWFLKLLVLALALPYLANATGWLFTEMGRQPWIVFGLLTTASGTSPSVSAGMVLTSLVGFTLVYLALIVATIYLMLKHIRHVPGDVELAAPVEPPTVTPLPQMHGAGD